jgi:3-methyladenine DNA glycosylase/8-oxoguanine DNA glycosylase
MSIETVSAPLSRLRLAASRLFGAALLLVLAAFAFLAPWLVEADPAALRAAGLSARKVETLQAIAAQAPAFVGR